MPTTIARPEQVRIVAVKRDESDSDDELDLAAPVRSRSELEVWNCTFPNSAWLHKDSTESLRGPQVRPAGHERPGSHEWPRAESAKRRR